MNDVDSVEEAVEIAKDRLVVDFSSSELKVFRQAISEIGISREQYVAEAVTMRLKSEGYLDPK